MTLFLFKNETFLCFRHIRYKYNKIMFHKISYTKDNRVLFQIVEADDFHNALMAFWTMFKPSDVLLIDVISIELWDANGDIDVETKADEQTILDHIAKIVYERKEEVERQYGSFAEGMNRAAQIFNAWTGLNIEAEHVYKMLVALKFSRESFNKKYDNMLDAMAYLTAYYEHYKQDYNKTK